MILDFDKMEEDIFLGDDSIDSMMDQDLRMEKNLSTFQEGEIIGVGHSLYSNRDYEEWN